MKKNWSQNLTSLKLLIFFKFSRCAIDCTTVQIDYTVYFFKNGAKYTMCNRLHSKSNRLHQ